MIWVTLVAFVFLAALVLAAFDYVTGSDAPEYAGFPTYPDVGAVHTYHGRDFVYSVEGVWEEVNDSAQND